MQKKPDIRSEICEFKEDCKYKKSKLELVLDFLREVLRYLDKNKLEACIFWAGVSLGIAAWAIGANSERINSIIQLFK